MISRPISGLKILIQEQSVFHGVARLDCTLTMIGITGLYKHDNRLGLPNAVPNVQRSIIVPFSLLRINGACERL